MAPNKWQLFVATMLLSLALRTGSSAQDTAPWRLSAYRIEVVLAVDDSARPASGVESRLAGDISDQLAAGFSPLWIADVRAADAAEHAACFETSDQLIAELTPAAGELDKLFFLGVRALPQGYALTCREFDVFTRHWSPSRERTIAQSGYLSEACVDLLADSFSPLARVAVKAGEGRIVELAFKGIDLPRGQLAAEFLRPGMAALPLLRRTDRSGQLLDPAAPPLPWTFFVIEPVKGDGWNGRIESASRNPLAVPRRGFVEIVVLALRPTGRPLSVRFFARRDQKQGLAGYEVFESTPPDGRPRLLGLTDNSGVVSVPLANGRLTTLLLRSGGRLLAKIPVASGAGDRIEAAIADDMALVRAQAEVQAIREELVDLVARRSIFATQTRRLLKEGKLDEARTLMDKLSELPTATLFGSQINAAQRRTSVTKDAALQRAIDSQFAAVRGQLAKFLDSRPLTELQYEINTAGEKENKSADGAETENPKQRKSGVSEPSDAPAAPDASGEDPNQTAGAEPGS